MSELTPKQRAYRALRIAAERMGAANYRAGRGVKRRRGRVVQVSPSAEHVEIILAMPRLLAGDISPAAAMSLLWQHDTMAQRLAD